MISVEEHLSHCLDVVRPLPPVELPLLDALGCVVVDDVVAAATLPGFDNSAMDGYAVHVEDVEEATAEGPVRLPVVGDLPAGVTDVPVLERGTAVRIMTGAPLPEGTGAVVPVEWTDAGTGTVSITRAPQPAQHVRRAGEDVVPGDLLVPGGTRLTARHVGVLAAAGLGRVRVRPRPRVVVLSTGSELVEPGLPLRTGQISESNGHALTAAAREVGADAVRAPIVPDDPEALVAAIEEHLDDADLVVTSGGVSAGAYDTVKEVLSRLGTVRFDRVAMQPGMPQGVGTVGDGVPIFTLPGNPVSSFVSFEVFVRPALRVMMGEQRHQRPTVRATAVEDWDSRPGKRQFVRVTLEWDEAGRALARPVGGHGSHLVADLARADALAVVPEDSAHVAAGDTVRCMVLDEGAR